MTIKVTALTWHQHRALHEALADAAPGERPACMLTKTTLSFDRRDLEAMQAFVGRSIEAARGVDSGSRSTALHSVARKIRRLEGGLTRVPPSA